MGWARRRTTTKQIISSDFSAWSPRTGLDSISRMKIPAFIITGWWDHCQHCSVSYYKELCTNGPVEQRKNTHLLIGPWQHILQVEHDYDFGAAAACDLENLENQFLDAHLNTGSPDLPFKVRLFILGENRWRDFKDWPVPGAKIQKLYLHPNGRLNQLACGLRESHTAFIYDPADPVPTTGGANNAPAIKLLPMGGGPRNQRDVCKRGDVVVFRTPAFKQKTTIVGPVELVLNASSSAVDTDFTAKLMLVNEDASDWMLLCDGIVRARYRNGRQSPEFLTPGKPEKYRIDLWNIAVSVMPGCSLALAISSSNFPRFSRNLNTGGDNERDDNWLIAEQKILHDAEHDSKIILHVID
jgi:putative CocE/NonD family hydrolase